jgi:hypothetical protein
VISAGTGTDSDGVLELTVVAPPKYRPRDKRSVGVVVPSELTRVDVDNERVLDGEMRSDPARALVAPRAADTVPLYVPVPPNLRTEPAADAPSANASTIMHINETVENLNFFISISLVLLVYYITQNPF